MMETKKNLKSPQKNKKIEKKIWPGYFDEVLSGNKTFEVRLYDFDVNEGDLLVLREWDPKTKKYTGRSIKRQVGYVLKFKTDKAKFWTKEDIEKCGLQVISLK